MQTLGQTHFNWRSKWTVALPPNWDLQAQADLGGWPCRIPLWKVPFPIGFECRLWGSPWEEESEAPQTSPWKTISEKNAIHHFMDSKRSAHRSDGRNWEWFKNCGKVVKLGHSCWTLCTKTSRSEIHGECSLPVHFRQGVNVTVVSARQVLHTTWSKQRDLFLLLLQQSAQQVVCLLLWMNWQWHTFRVRRWSECKRKQRFMKEL